MDLARSIYSRDLKIAAMRALDGGSTSGEIARKYQLSPKLLERWRGEWRAKGELAFPGLGRRGGDLTPLDDARRIAELERQALTRHRYRLAIILGVGDGIDLRTIGPCSFGGNLRAPVAGFPRYGQL